MNKKRCWRNISLYFHLKRFLPNFNGKYFEIFNSLNLSFLKIAKIAKKQILKEYLQYAAKFCSWFFFCGLIKLKKVFDKNSKVQLFLCLYSDGLNLRHFKLRVIDLTEFIVWNIWGLWHSLCHNWPPHVVFYITQKVLVWGCWNFLTFLTYPKPSV